jgi:hypothetical protein
VLSLFCADETSRVHQAISLVALQVQGPHWEEAKKGRGAGRKHVHVQALLLPGCHQTSVVGIFPVPLRFLLSTLLMHMKKTTDRFMRDTVCSCHCAERFLLLHHTMHDHQPVFSGNAVVRVCWPWSPFVNHRRRTGVMCFIVSEQQLDLEIELASRSKEEVENW